MRAVKLSYRPWLIGIASLVAGLFFVVMRKPSLPPGVEPIAVPEAAVSEESPAKFAEKQIKEAKRKLASLPSPPQKFKRIKNLQEFKSVFGSDWTIKETNTGQPRWIYGADIPIGDPTPERVLEFTRSIGPALGLNERDIGNEPAVMASDPTMPEDFGTRIYRMERTYQGFNVIDGAIRVGVDLGSKSVYSIQVSAPIQQGAPLNTQSVPLQNIKQRVEARLNIQLANPAITQPQILALPEKQPVLVYQLNESIDPTQKGPKAKVYYVNAQSGEVVLERNAGFID